MIGAIAAGSVRALRPPHVPREIEVAIGDP